ncbi:MAG: hypothetical protein DCF32_14615 [Leptolyngbya sp.]|nr:MAG: hypothetical protein DCF32_14615 [Leptolyngbya sp.]
MLSRIHWKQFAVACSAIVILLTANGVKAEQTTGSRAYSEGLPPTQDVGRPRTMGQWEAESESLEGQPGKRLKRIAEESADAVKDMAEIYPQNAKTLTPGVDNGTLPSDD